MKISQKNTHIAKMTLFFGLMAGLLLVALTSLWLNRVIYNTERFTTTTVEAFNEPSSRESIGDLVASRVFENKPVLKVALSDRLSNYVSGLLGTEVATSSVERLAREGQLLFTSPQRDPITLELSTLKPIIASAQELVQKDEAQRRIDVSDIPDSVTVIDTAKLPNFHATLVYMQVAGPLALLSALLLAGYWLIKGGKRNLYKRSRILLLVVIGSALVAVMVGPLTEPVFISLGRDASAQTLLGNLYRSFSAPFVNQAMWLGMVSAFVLVALSATHEFKKRYKVSMKVKVTKKAPK